MVTIIAIVAAVLCLAWLTVAVMLVVSVIEKLHAHTVATDNLRLALARHFGQAHEASRPAEGDDPPASSAAHLPATHLRVIGRRAIPTSHPHATENP